MKRFIVAFLLTGLSLSCNTISVDLSGTSREEELHYNPLFDLIATTDGGFLTGVTRYHSIATVTTTNDLLHPTYQYDPASTFADLMVIKTDANGNRQWEKVLELPDEQSGKKLLLLPNGNYLVAGNVTNKSFTKHDVILSELSPNGQERSSRQLAKSGTGLTLNDLRNDPSGDLFMAGYQSKAGDLTFRQSDWIARLSPDGSSTRWALSATDSTSLPEGTRFDSTPDGNLFVVGYRSINNSSAAYFRKISYDGAVRWTQDVNDVGGFRPRQLYTTADGGFLVAGAAFRISPATARQIVLLKADGNGKVQSVQWFDTGIYTGDDEHEFLSKRPDGQFVLAIWQSDNRVTLTPMDANGNSTKTITTTSTLSFAPTPVFLSLANGDMLLAERRLTSLQAKEISLHRIGSDGKEIWQRVISSL